MKKLENLSCGNIKIGTVSIKYFLKYSNRKTIEIKIKRDGQIYVSAPFYVSIKEIEEFIVQKSSWITDKLETVNDFVMEEKKSLLNLKSILFNGIDTPLFISRSKVNKGRAEVREEGLIIEIPEGFRDNEANLLIAKLLNDFYLVNTKKYLILRLSYFEEFIGVKPKKVAIRNQKSRWGSCSSKQNINFNLKLSMTPDYVFDYIIVHELCHLKELNHSNRFWNLVKDILPEYELAKAWLKNNTYKLMII